MAINLVTQYPGKVNPADGDYPFGSARNITTPGDGTGTPWEAAIVNDFVGWMQSVLTEGNAVPTGTPDKVGASQYLDALNKLYGGRVKSFDTFAAAIGFDSSDQPLLKRTATLSFSVTSGVGVGAAEYVRTGSTGASSTGDVDDFFDAGGIGWTRVDKTTRFGSFSLVIDTTNAFVRDSVLPVVTTKGFAAALAIPLSAIESDYTRMTLPELHEYIRAEDGEVLSHAINGITLDASVQTSYGNSSIRTSKSELVQDGFRANAFVAITSVLDDKFKPEVKKWYDYAYIRSVDGSTPSDSVNDPDSDVFNLTRTGLESGTEQQMKDVADFAKNTFQNVVYFTHDSLTNLTTTLDHVIAIGLKFELPSTWMARIHGLKKPMVPKPTENLLNNTELKKVLSTDNNPIGWTITTSTMTSVSAPVTTAEFGGVIDINGLAAAADERLLFSQIYNSGDVAEFTPFTFSINARSLDLTNTTIRMTLAAKDAGSSVITQDVKDYVIRGGRQRLFAHIGVIPSGTAVSFIQCTVELISIAAGAVRAICDTPTLERVGLPTAYKKTRITSSFLKTRNNAATSVAGGVDHTLIFDALLAGNVLGTGYDDITGKWKNEDGRKVDIVVNAGFQNMNADEKITIKVFRGGVLNEKVDYTTREGATDLVGQLVAIIVNDGSEYEIKIVHDSVSNRNLTVGFDSMLTISSRVE